MSENQELVGDESTPLVRGENQELVGELAAELDRMTAMFAERGFARRLGYGSRPAILVVDMCRAFTSPDSVMGGDVDAEVEATRTLLEAGRAKQIPVLMSIMEFRSPADESGLFGAKGPSGAALLMRGSKWTEVDDRLEPREGEQIFAKNYPSCFYGTDLASRLTNKGVDTLLITGLSTSGCVRATCVDACSAGFRPIVVREGVGDRMQLAHTSSLFDIDLKYGDVVNLDDAIDYLAKL